MDTNKLSLTVAIIAIILGHLLLGSVLHKLHKRNSNSEEFQNIPLPPPQLPQVPEERKPNISETVPRGQLSYDGVMQWLDRLHQEAPDQTEVGVIGQSTQGRDIKYIRVGPSNDGPKVLITACVHGNEKLCCAASLACVSRMLKEYMEDDRVTELLRTRQFYYIPIACPDGYVNNSRHVDGLDPNRNWNGRNLSEIQSIPSVQAVKDFHLKHEFDAVMSCHNYGRIYFIPWGYENKKSDYFDDYRRIMGKMGEESGYDWEQLLRQSAPPYHGYEVDWYHKHGAFSIVNEIGRRFAANPDEVELETRANYPAFLTFIEEGPLVTFNENTPLVIFSWD